MKKNSAAGPARAKKISRPIAKHPEVGHPEEGSCTVDLVAKQCVSLCEVYVLNLYLRRKDDVPGEVTPLKSRPEPESVTLPRAAKVSNFGDALLSH